MHSGRYIGLRSANAVFKMNAEPAVPDENGSKPKRTHEFFKAVSDDDITQADRNIVELKQDSTQEDAFFL